jgi:hypothetical protein
MALDPQLLAQALRTPESQDVTETPIVRAIVLQDPANAADLVPVLARADALEARNARRVLCAFAPDAAPVVAQALATTATSPRARAEGLAVLWALLATEEPRVVQEQLAAAWDAVGVLLRDPAPVPDELPAHVERDFPDRRVCDVAYTVVEELRDTDFDQSTFRALDADGRDRAIAQLLSRGGGAVA